MFFKDIASVFLLLSRSENISLFVTLIGCRADQLCAEAVSKPTVSPASWTGKPYICPDVGLIYQTTYDVGFLTKWWPLLLTTVAELFLHMNLHISMYVQLTQPDLSHQSVAVCQKGVYKLYKPAESYHEKENTAPKRLLQLLATLVFTFMSNLHFYFYFLSRIKVEMFYFYHYAKQILYI